MLFGIFLFTWTSSLGMLNPMPSSSSFDSSLTWLSDPCNDTRASILPYCSIEVDKLLRARDLVSRFTLSEIINFTMGGYVDRIEQGIRAPPLDGSECLHGAGTDFTQYNHGYRPTSFPQGVAMGASFDTNLIRRIGKAIATEARAKKNLADSQGIHGSNLGIYCVAPMVNLLRDPRWGRSQETFGEDPSLASQLGSAFTQGLKGDNLSNPYYLTVPILKHFDVHGGPEGDPRLGFNWAGSRLGFDAIVGARDMMSTFQPAFRASIHEGAMGVMCSYNAINGVPSCANFALQTELLRNTWHCGNSSEKCYVVSDAGAVANTYTFHHFAKSFEEAAAMSVLAGVDTLSGISKQQLQNALDQEMISKDDLSISVVRAVYIQMIAGIYDPPSVVAYKSIPASAIDSPSHRKLALNAARKAMTLLENRQSTLPLEANSYVAVIGPLANDSTAVHGSYSVNSNYTVTVLQGMKAALGAKKVIYAEGCPTVECNTSNFTAAVEAARNRIAIVVVGLTWDCLCHRYNTTYENRDHCSYKQPTQVGLTCEMEGMDRLGIKLPGSQEQLVKQVSSVASRTIVVLINGAEVSSPWISEHADALLDAFYAGQETGTAVTDVLLGNFNPAGRLPYTIHTSVNDIPNITNYNMDGSIGRTYRFFKRKPLYPFGFGRSYTTFKYLSITITPPQIQPCEPVRVCVELSNTGNITGEEVVQLYLWHLNASVPVTNSPSLKHFARIELAPGTSRTINFTLSAMDRGVVMDDDFSWAVEPGSLILYASGGQPNQIQKHKTTNTVSATLEVSGSTRRVDSCD